MTDQTTKPDAASGAGGFGFSTLAVHAGNRPEPHTGARVTPIYQTSSFVFDSVDHAASLFNLQTFGNIYSRLGNPSVSALEERVAALEGGRGATACASGHAAQFLALASLMEAGDDLVASRFLYGGSYTQFSQSFKRFGWGCSFVDARDPDEVARAIGPRTKAVFVESQSNPSGVLTDIAALADVAHAHGLPLIVDNTIPSPYLCRPFDLGADLVTHSLTKFLGGHGNSLGGAIVESGRFGWKASGKFPSLSEPNPGYHGLRFEETFGDFAFTVHAHAVALRDFGPTLSPFNAFMIMTGIETLPLRMDRHVANAKTVAAWLEAHPKVAWVSYAGLPSSPQYDLGCRQMPRGVAPVFTFGLKGGYEAGIRLVESVELFSHLANVGDTRSLILHPASTTHRQLSPEDRTKSGAGDDVIRISIGIETVDDLIADLDQAFAQI
ncbi:O-acetylhomoserine aminocarboxypropyltransferase [Tistrella mobilis]|uniref:O-acetylhomoserine sulfhydrylase n=1 Tax=Tistrella mobilis (strain KA081020-065) TaxID=1110502 RepID=I3TLJ4_TISMK|nr:O-acetylhomoserine aminocarboxypropyltransferase [Tistrella mobilis]AFK53632.1 O-acetylhomoserine sulfhydrylase [Tistrella mobilis KA081020-065]